MTAGEVSVDGFLLNGTDGYGAKWTLREEQGWFDGLDMRRDRTLKVAQDGAWESKGSAGPRTVVLSGLCRCVDRVTAMSAARTFRSLIGGGRGEMMWVEDDLTLSAVVERDDRPRVSFVSDRIFEWQLTLTAPDPLLYGSPTFSQASLSGTGGGSGLVYPLAYPLDYGVPAGVTPGSLSLSNVGTAGYWPRLRIDGPVPNPVVTLVETGDWVKFTGAVAEGQWLDIDLANRRVLLNGQVSVRQFVTSSGSWLRVPPGGASMSWTADGADPAALLSVWGYEGAWV